MVLVLSQSYAELSTELVIDWLTYFKVPYFRLNGDDFVNHAIEGNFALGNVDPKHECSFGNINFKAVKVAWFRRWMTYDFTRDIKSHDVKKHLKSELSAFSEYLFYSLRSVKGLKWLSDPDRTGVNKLEVLNLATKYGLRIPSTRIVLTSQALKDFKKQSPIGIIVKPLSYSPFIFDHRSDYRYMMYTEEVAQEDMAHLPSRFLPSLVQEKIEKEYEIRTFYISGTFYSIAVFSQSKDETQVDMRKYDFSNMNRQCTYKLPNQIEQKIQKLMDALHLETGSIDLIYKQGKYTFLEVNPVGQIGPVSDMWGGQVERSIAETLKNKWYE